jgi:drug/metabolite transporter (DMT)-like permease
MPAPAQGPKQGAAWASLLLVQFLFGGLPVVSKFAIAEVAPQVLVLCRSFTATLVFALLFAWRGRNSRLNSGLAAPSAPSAPSRALGARDHLQLVGLAFLGVTFNQTILFYGLQRTTAAASAILAPMIPVFALVLSLLLGRERFAWSKLANIAMAVSGVALIFAPHLDETFSGATAIGNLMCLASTLSYASYLALAPPVIARMGSLRFSLRVFLWASALNVVGYFLLTGTAPADVPGAFVSALPALSATFWAALGYVVVGATVVTYLLNAFALSRLAPGVVGGFICLQTVIGVSLSNVLLSEPFPPEYGAAMALIIAGVVVLAVSETRRAGKERRRRKDESARASAVSPP